MLRETLDSYLYCALQVEMLVQKLMRLSLAIVNDVLEVHSNECIIICVNLQIFYKK